MNGEDAAPSILAILINWFPTFLFAALWLYYFRKTIVLQQIAIDQTRRTADALERVAATLEKRS